MTLPIPWHQLVGAVRTPGAAPFAGFAHDGNALCLGWVSPPPWSAIEPLLTATMAALTKAKAICHCFVSTGPWCDALQLVDPSGSTISTLGVVDPVRLDAALTRLPSERCSLIAVTQSGRTIETRALVAALSPAWTAIEPIWLSSNDSLGRLVFPIELAPGWHVNALFSAPLSLPFYAALSLHCGVAGAQRLHHQLLERLEDLGMAAVELATSLPVVGSPSVLLNVRQGHGAARRYVLQLARQSLAGKSATFAPYPALQLSNPDLCLGPPAWISQQGIEGCMEELYFWNVLVASWALRVPLPFARHDNVEHYKRWIVAGGDHDQLILNPHALITWLDRWTGGAEPFRLHIVCYGQLGDETLMVIAALAERDGLEIEVHPGSDWNHHSFQAAYGSSLAVAVFLGELYPRPARELTHEAVRSLAATCKRIARATVTALGQRACLFDGRP